MITHISIRDFATIENLEISLSPGLSMITGETGAGKSIIIESISLALGSRADSSMVRAGKSKAVIQVVADTPFRNIEDGLAGDQPLQGQGGVDGLAGTGDRRSPLQEVEPDPFYAESEVILTREIFASGKSVARINDNIVSLAKLAAFSSALADIHGQYDHQSLFKSENHVALVDSYHWQKIKPVKAKVHDAWRLWRDSKNRLDDLLKNEADTKRSLDFMRFELDEIRRADPKPGELEALKERLAILQNSGHIFDKLSVARNSLFDGSPSALDSLGSAMRALKEISSYSGELADMENAVSESYYAVEDIIGAMRTVTDKIEFSPEALDETISRLDKLERLCSKYGGTVEKTLGHLAELEVKLGNIENIESLKDELSKSAQEAEERLAHVSSELTALRKEAAAGLETAINSELAELNFANARFAVDFKETGDARFSENGADDVEFLISTNRGQALLPLVKIASGGEMSRMMLAFKSVIAKLDPIPTMIFDEIDNGISGVTASIVGRKLIDMSKDRQIVCITHLPQIAACGEHHLMISKSSDDLATFTTIEELDGDGRAEEIARLLGGANITGITLDSARELIALSRG